MQHCPHNKGPEGLFGAFVAAPTDRVGVIEAVQLGQHDSAGADVSTTKARPGTFYFRVDSFIRIILGGGTGFGGGGGLEGATVPPSGFFGGSLIGVYSVRAGAPFCRW